MKKWWSKLRIQLWSHKRRAESGNRALFPNQAATSGEWEIHASPEQQEAIHQAIRWYGRRKLRREIDAVHRRLIVEQPEGALARQLRQIFPAG